MFLRYQCIHWYNLENYEEERMLSCNHTFLFFKLEYMYIDIVQNNKQTQTSCVCFQHVNTRSGRMFGRVGMLKTNTVLVRLFAIYTI